MHELHHSRKGEQAIFSPGVHRKIFEAKVACVPLCVMPQSSPKGIQHAIEARGAGVRVSDTKFP